MQLDFTSFSGAMMERFSDIAALVRRFTRDDQSVTYFTHGDEMDPVYHVYINDSLFGWARKA